MHTIRASKRASTAIVWGVSLVGSLFILLPIVFMIGTALKSDQAVLSVPVRLVPSAPKFSNFSTATRIIPFWREMANSALVAGLGAIGTVLSSAMAAYPLARIKVRGMRVVFMIILLTILL
ncbi:MAG: carbohydrate ABC transporter permease, partial [Actinomycetota bacterium]|nr:carbohydrate ABC transporter permease [Actinomycetota bacterium]